MNYAKRISSSIGELFLIANEQTLIAIDIIPNALYDDSTKQVSNAILNETHKQLDEYFNGLRRNFKLPIGPLGTPFQNQVWKALVKIPYGKVWSYSEQAKFLNSPKAYRAVGSANGKNPIPIIIPCHRVIGSDGKLIGYSGGLNMKIELLRLEGHHINDLQLMKK